MWRGGCIIRSRFLGKIKEAFDKNPELENLLLDSFFSQRSEQVSGIVAQGAGPRRRVRRAHAGVLHRAGVLTTAIAPRGCPPTCCRRSATTSARTPMSASTSRAASSSTPTGRATEAGFRPRLIPFSFPGKPYPLPEHLSLVSSRQAFGDGKYRNADAALLLYQQAERIQQVPRQINRNLIFNQIRTRQPISRAVLALGLQRNAFRSSSGLLVEHWIVEGSLGRVPADETNVPESEQPAWRSCFGYSPVANHFGRNGSGWFLDHLRSLPNLNRSSTQPPRRSKR